MLTECYRTRPCCSVLTIHGTSDKIMTFRQSQLLCARYYYSQYLYFLTQSLQWCHEGDAKIFPILYMKDGGMGPRTPGVPSQGRGGKVPREAASTPCRCFTQDTRWHDDGLDSDFISLGLCFHPCKMGMVSPTSQDYSERLVSQDV